MAVFDSMAAFDDSAPALVRSPRTYPVRLARGVLGAFHENHSQCAIPRSGLRRRVGRIVRRERRTLRTRRRRYAFLAPRKMNGHWQPPQMTHCKFAAPLWEPPGRRWI